MKCRICNTRKPRRHCPGLGADICSICCGAEREVGIRCPFECEYLAEARKHDKPVVINPEEVPNKDIRVSEEFLRQQEPLLVFLGAKLLGAALETPGVVDNDVRQAVDSLTRTYRTLQSGLYYETRPDNLIAASVHQKIQEAIEVLRKELAAKGATAPRDAEILGVLVFLQRMELTRSNGRVLGRAFIDYLREHFPYEKPSSVSETPSLIQV